jgi:hypothetical protein
MRKLPSSELSSRSMAMKDEEDSGSFEKKREGGREGGRRRDVKSGNGRLRFR